MELFLCMWCFVKILWIKKLVLRVYRKQPLYFYKVGIRLRTHSPWTQHVGLYWVCGYFVVVVVILECAFAENLLSFWHFLLNMRQGMSNITSNNNILSVIPFVISGEGRVYVYGLFSKRTSAQVQQIKVYKKINKYDTAKNMSINKECSTKHSKKRNNSNKIMR